jgi:D-serine deaminase-like pyridoxal phosphate-dependent protein
MQMEAGAVGLTTATIGEAEVFVGGGLEDIFVAYPLWLTPRKAHRLRALCDRARIAVGTSSVRGAEQLVEQLGRGCPIDVIVEINCGDNRTGVSSVESALEIARICESGGLFVNGVFSHAGHSYASPEGGKSAAADEVRALSAAAETLRENGHDVSVVSAGSTPTALLSATGAVNEERPGTFVFGDRQQAALGAHRADCVALFVAATVVAAESGSFVLDAGAKVFTKDLPRTVEGYAAFPAFPEAVVERLDDHHAVASSRGGRTPRIGERVAMIPNHVCPVANLATEFVVLNPSGEQVNQWPVDARARNA